MPDQAGQQARMIDMGMSEKDEGKAVRFKWERPAVQFLQGF